jgi:hypothetical protein
VAAGRLGARHLIPCCPGCPEPVEPRVACPQGHVSGCMCLVLQQLPLRDLLWLTSRSVTQTALELVASLCKGRLMFALQASTWWSESELPGKPPSPLGLAPTYSEQFGGNLCVTILPELSCKGIIAMETMYCFICFPVQQGGGGELWKCNRPASMLACGLRRFRC